LIVSGIIAFAKKRTVENHEKTKDSAVVRIDGSWNYRRNGSRNILGIIGVGSRKAVDFEIVQKANTPGQSNYQGSGNRMKMEAMSQMPKR
jgi:hypothetical protein